jgi:hypothetical protein
LFALTAEGGWEEERDSERDRAREGGLERLYWHKSVTSHRIAIGATGKRKKKKNVLHYDGRRETSV